MQHPLKNYVFFGSSSFSELVLEKLFTKGFPPKLIVTTPPAIAGRKKQIKTTEAMKWASSHNIEVFHPTTLDLNAAETLKKNEAEVFIVAAYGKIVPKNILDLPRLRAFNIHPSMLPRYRGPSPIQSQILDDEDKPGVSIIKMDEQVDHGPILSQKELVIEEKNVQNYSYTTLGKTLFEIGSDLLVEGLDGLTKGLVKPVIQNETKATFTKKLDAPLALNPENAKDAWLKFLAL